MPAQPDNIAKPRRRSAVTPKQEAYAEARATGVQLLASMSAAGFTPNPGDAARLEKMPPVRDLINAKKRENAYMLGLTRDKVLEGMMEAVNQAKILADPLTQIAGWREIAKVCGFYAPEVKRVELGEGAKTYLARLEQMSDEELLKIANAPIVDVEFTEVKNE